MWYDPQALGDGVVEDEALSEVHSQGAVEGAPASGLVSVRASDGIWHGDVARSSSVIWGDP